MPLQRAEKGNRRGRINIGNPVHGITQCPTSPNTIIQLPGRIKWQHPKSVLILKHIVHRIRVRPRIRYCPVAKTAATAPFNHCVILVAIAPTQ